MLRTAAVLTALGSAVFLGGCGDDPPAPVAAPTPTPTPTETTYADNEERYLDVIEAEWGDHVNESLFVSFGHATCEYIREYGVDDYFDSVIRETESVTGYPVWFNAFASGAAIGAFCPEYADEVNSL